MAVIRGGGGGSGSSSRLSRTRRFINVVTSCRRYCRGVSVTTEADVAFLIKRSRRQGSLHCVRIVGGDVGKGLVLTTRPASLYNPAVDQFQSTTTTAIWRDRERIVRSLLETNDRIFVTSIASLRSIPLFSTTTATHWPGFLALTIEIVSFSFFFCSFSKLEYAGRGNCIGTLGTSLGENDARDDDEHYRKAIQFGFLVHPIRIVPSIRFLARNIETDFRFHFSEERYRSRRLLFET